MARKELTIEEARERAEKLEAWGESIAEDHKLASRFADAGPSCVVDMWANGKNEKGRPLSKFEGQALIERWCELFGSLPPSMGDASTAPAPPPVPEPDDGATMTMRQVSEFTTLSPSTIKRRVRDDKKFPKPRRISPRRIVWSARAMKEWFDKCGAS